QSLPLAATAGDRHRSGNRRPSSANAQAWLRFRRLEAAMSEQGWRRFLAAEGVADWVVLHGGAMAVFRVPSLAEAARLAEAVARISRLDGALMTLTDGQLTVRLTRGMFRLEERHVELAQAVSAVAREHGATADRTLAQEVQLAIAAQPDAID